MTMHRLKLTIITLVFIFFGLWGGILYLEYTKTSDLAILGVSTSAPTPTPLPTPTSTPAIVPSIPVSISIPTINLNAAVESVGLDAEGKMDVPTRDEDVAWYSLGYKPGDKGSAVLAGHLDTRSGAPAVFWDLDKLAIGEEIIVTDDKNQTFKFQVTGSKTYAYNQVPLEEIFASSGEGTLNLITCGGAFNQAARNYSHRTVVSAKLIES